MSLATELAGPAQSTSTLSLAPDFNESPFEISELERNGIELFLLGTVSAQVFEDAYAKPQWGPVGEVVFNRTYSREDQGGTGPDGKERWSETVRRVVVGNLGYAPEGSHLPEESIELFWAIYNFKFMPAGRHLWVTGTKVSKLSRNCWVSGWSRNLSSHFRFLSARLFEGGGVGSNYSDDLIASTPPVLGTTNVRFTCKPDHADIDAIRAAAAGHFVEQGSAAAGQSGWVTITVPDTREGWTSTWGDLIDSVVVADDHRFIFDVSDVRPHGAVLNTFGGTASGPAPLVTAVVTISDVLNRAAATERRITGMDAMDIDHVIACSVVAGGARRSARLAAMHWTDPEVFDFISCKSAPGAHWTANISVEVDGAFAEALAINDAHALSVLDAVATGMAANGEPGLIDTAFMSADEPRPVRVTNPCGEATLTSDEDAAGESCNLGSVNLDAFGTDHAGAMHAFRLLSRFLYRATLNEHPDPGAGRIEAKNRRLGVGIMGTQGWAAAHGYRLTELASSEPLRNRLTDFRTAARASADALADELGLPRPVKVTAVAPTGTIAKLPGCTPGIHPVYARRFIQRVRFALADTEWKKSESKGYVIETAVNEDLTMIVQYPMIDAICDTYGDDLIEQSDEVTLDQFFDLMAAVQETFCGHGHGQAVSATAVLPVGSDPIEVASSLRRVLGSVKGLTAFPDNSHVQPPYERLSKDQFAAIVASGAPVASGGDSNDGDCGTGGCPIR